MVKHLKLVKKTWFDYLNYIIIILLLIFLAYSVHTLYQKNKQQPREKANVYYTTTFNGNKFRAT